VVATLTGNADQSVSIGAANSAAAAIPVVATVKSVAKTANEIWYVIFEENTLDLKTYNPASPGSTQPAATLLFGALENTDTGKFKAIDLSTNLQLVSGKSVAFFEVTDGTKDGSLTGKTAKLLSVNPATDTGVVTVGAAAESATSSGFSFELKTLATTDPALNDLGHYVARDQDKAAILNFTGLTATDTITGIATVTREADYSSKLGFYRIANTDGAVLDGTTLIYPGQAGYSAAALKNVVTGSLSQLDGITVNDNDTKEIGLSFNSTDLLAPYAIVNGADTYFAFAAANPDKVNHFRTLGTNTVGFEDTRGGGDFDFDDNVIKFNFNNLPLG